MSTVFISYRHVEPDASLASQLANALSAADHRVFIDTSITPGREWGEVIETELAGADCLIAVLSEASAASPMVVTEIAEAHTLNVKRGRPMILPVRLGGDFKLHFPLSAYVTRFQQVAWNGPADTEGLIAQISAALAVPSARPRVASQRLSMIQRVRADWITGLLETSLYRVARLELGLAIDHTAVTRGLDVIVQRPDEGPRPLPSGTSLTQVFDDHRGQLLILGPPGGGKTTLLLELARDLLDRAEQDEQQPIPVVFNLSSWALQRLPLDAWLVEELHLRSDAPPKLARDWVEHEQIMPLLDGLDEVVDDHRAQCVAAINTYRREHGWVPIVICSRIAEYEALTDALALPGAVVVQPLQRSQVQAYLESAGDALAGVRQALAAAPQLWDLLEVPLMVSVLALAYQNRGDVPRELGEEELFDQYLDTMFRRRTREQRYPESDMRAWLHWLAANQVEHSQSVFFLEDVVPERFLTPRLALTVNVVMVAITAMLSSLWLYFVMRTGDWLTGSSNQGWWLVAAFSAPVAIALSLFYGRRSGPVDALRFSFPGWRDVLTSAARGTLLGALAGGILGYAGCQAIMGGVRPSNSDHEFAVQSGLGMAGVGAFALAALYAVRTLLTVKMLGRRREPGALIRRSIQSALIIFLLSAIVGVPFAGRGVFDFDNGLVASVRGVLLVSLPFLGWAGIFVAFERGGYFVIRHYLARLVLWTTRRAPWRVTRFLDVAAERLLLRRVGGGYIFMHRRLMEHLARVAPRIVSPTIASGT